LLVLLQREPRKVFPPVLLFSLLLLLALASVTVTNGIGGNGLNSLSPDRATPQQQSVVGEPQLPIHASLDQPGSQQRSHGAGFRESPGPDGVVSSVTSVVCEPGMVRVGLDTTCTGTVTGTGNGAPTGNVTLSASSTDGGAVSISRPSGSAGCPCYFGVTGSSVGIVTITATYSGDKNYAGSSGIFTLKVVPIPTKTFIDCSFSTLQVGQSVLCSAKVSPAAAGSVTFTQVGISDPAGTLTLSVGACTLNSSGFCFFRATGASPGTGKLFGSYSGDRTHEESSGSAAFTVVPAKTMTTATCTVQLAVGGSGKCTVLVTSSPNSPPLTGDTVSLTQTSKDGGSVKLASESCTLKNAPYTCEVSLTGVSAGTVTIGVNFDGDRYNAPSGSIPTVRVVQAACENTDIPGSSCSVPVPEFGAPAVLVAALGIVILAGLRAITRTRRVAGVS
jgi:large repetitive protein